MPVCKVPEGWALEVMEALGIGPEGYAVEFQNDDTIALLHYKNASRSNDSQRSEERMVVNEKALLSRMKEAYKTGGYTVAVNEDRHIIIGSTWAVEIDSDNVPRDVIGLFAVHMGFLPKPDTAHKITKTKVGPYAQSMIYDDAMKTIEAMDSTLAAVGITKTMVTLEGCNVWQQNIGTAVHLIRPDLEELFSKNEDVRFAGYTFRSEGKISRGWVMEALVDPEDAKIRCLSSIRWTA